MLSKVILVFSIGCLTMTGASTRLRRLKRRRQEAVNSTTYGIPSTSGSSRYTTEAYPIGSTWSEWWRSMEDLRRDMVSWRELSVDNGSINKDLSFSRSVWQRPSASRHSSHLERQFMSFLPLPISALLMVSIIYYIKRQRSIHQARLSGEMDNSWVTRLRLQIQASNFTHMDGNMLQTEAAPQAMDMLSRNDIQTEPNVLCPAYSDQEPPPYTEVLTSSGCAVPEAYGNSAPDDGDLVHSGPPPSYDYVISCDVDDNSTEEVPENAILMENITHEQLDMDCIGPPPYYSD